MSAYSGDTVTPPRILVIEDEPTIRRFYERFCDAQGYEPILAPTGDVALELLESGQYFDAILLDVRLPGVSGRGIWKAMELNRPELCSRVIIVTADIVSESTRELIEQSGRPCLEKPFSTQQLAEIIEAVICSPPEESGRDRCLGS